MKKRKLIMFGMVIFALILAACGSPTEPATDTPEVDPPTADTGGEGDADMLPDLGGREVIVVVENAYLPFNYIDLADGQPKGWDYDAWEEICNLLNCVPVFVEAVWEGMIQGISEGQWDVAADGITITEERDEIVDFSDGYVSIDQRLLVRADEDRISEIEDIADDPDLILGTQFGTTNYDTATDFIAEDLISTFDTFPFAIQALLSGDIDAVIIDEVAGQGYLGENADALKLVGRSLSSDLLGFAFPNGSDLVDPVNQALQAMADNGFLAEINAKYFGDSFTVTYDDVGDGAYAEDEESGLPDLGGREVLVVVENAYLPFNYIDLADGQPKGWDYDAWEEICNLLNCVPVFVEAVWEGMIQGISEGQWDVAADGITITEERDEIVDFSDGYVSIDQRLLVRADEDRISEIEDIADDPDLILGTQFGTTNYDTATDFIAEDLISTFDTFPFAIQALLSGDIDAVIIDEVAGQGYLGENADALKLVGRSLSSDLLGFAFPNGSDLVDPVNQALQAMADNGFLAEINAKYFGDSFTVTYDDVGDGAYSEE